jgi:hypothetical protein
MSKSKPTENQLLQSLFQNAALPAYGGTLYISLHSADPGENGDQSTNEVTYTGYARVAVSRTAAGFAVTNNLAQNAATITFPSCTGGSATATHVSVGIAPTGAGQILYSGPLTAALAISNLITPQFAANALQVTED